MAITQRQLFLDHLAQTTDFPMSLEIVRAEGSYMYDPDGKSYLDLISGISVSSIGHRHPKVVEAIKNQVDQYMHLMVYGEYIQTPQVALAQKLAELLGEGLDSTYFVNSGSEANEGAMKLAKRATGRAEIISMKKAYHGSTQGVLSIIGDEDFKRGFRPLLPGTRSIQFDSEEELERITSKTAAVIVEPIQGEAGYIPPSQEYLGALRKKCNETGALLIFDEVQCGFGRTGKMFAHQHYGIKPDIITLAKGMGGGMPIGAFIASRELMAHFKENPILGHITTFGGHPVSCAASLACVNVIVDEKLADGVKAKAELFKELLVHPKIEEMRGKGLMLAVQLDTFENVQKVIDHCLKNGVVSDWFLFCDNAIRLSPPLNIDEEDIRKACKILLEGVDLI
ncbi:aspartate aminotransferase family protein [Owenweeksia hongkongensis]|uniref:aspartate aminotransferase family protein n=1 Tax=Owenweeksia hongkongensis TaxID=253245 RepID=UPI003A9507DB